MQCSSVHKFSARMVYKTIRSYVQRVTITEGHATYEQLENLTLPLWKSFYFFNLTNPEEFEAGNKPVLVEVGPYSYRYIIGFRLVCEGQLLTLSRLHCLTQ